MQGPDPKNDKMDGFPPVRSIAFAALLSREDTCLPPAHRSIATCSGVIRLGELTSDRRMEALSILRRPRRPRALVLAPTRELARQILSVLKSVGHVCKVSSDILVGGDDYGAQRKRLADRPVDVLIAFTRDAGDVFLGSVRHVVIDEMDTMLEQGFQGDIGKLLHRCYIRRRWWRWRNTKMAN